MTLLNKAELASKDRFDEVYRLSTNPVMQGIERQVCGCDYGGNSWTSRDQAETLIYLLGLNADAHLLDLGAGSGWPGIYLAKKCGCQVHLVDLPEMGLQVAARRAMDEGLEGRVLVTQGDAADLPVLPGKFDAISHSDLLCCLVRKRDVLFQCRKVIKPTGRMAFTVISLSPNLTDGQYARAIANAPEFVETNTGYRDLLRQTGWQLDTVTDLTEEYAQSCARQIAADEHSRADLEALLGLHEADARMENWHAKLDAILDGLFRRELFLCDPT